MHFTSTQHCLHTIYRFSRCLTLKNPLTLSLAHELLTYPRSREPTISLAHELLRYPRSREPTVSLANELLTWSTSREPTYCFIGPRAVDVIPVVGRTTARQVYLQEVPRVTCRLVMIVVILLQLRRHRVVQVTFNL